MHIAPACTLFKIQLCKPPIQAHLDILISPELGYFFERDESSFSILDVINQKGVVYFALLALRYPGFSKILGKLVINDIKSVIERRNSDAEARY
ncbi:MAG TPA: hypothetical protein VJN02_03940 [Gammaproteobacteria bacterium]|nr:hypothetical protein [Gammaproteobacteria bacterium]